MAAEDRILKILLQLRADVADSAKVTGALKEIEVQAVKTTAAVSGAGQPASLFNKQPGFQGYTVAEQAQIAALINGRETQSIANAERLALAEARRVVMVTELEAAEARIAGNNVMAGTLEREAQIRAQSLSLQRTLNISSADAIILAERLVQAEEAVAFAKSRQVAQTIAQKEASVAALEVERARIVALQLQAAELRAASVGTSAAFIGPPSTAFAASLEREADIRTRSLALQRSLNISATEGLAIAERQVLAEEAIAIATAQAATASAALTGSTLLTGMNVGKARQEAIVLAREIAVGNVRASTMGSLLGSFGTTLTIAGIAGYELFQVVSHMADEVVRLSNEYKKQTGEVENQVTGWFELAKAAGDFGDTLKLAEKIVPDLQSMQVKLAEFRANELLKWRGWGDEIERIFRGIEVSTLEAISKLPGFKGVEALGVSRKTSGQTAAEEAADKEIKRLAAAQLAEANLAVDVSKRYAAEVARIGQLAPKEQVTIYQQKVNELQAELDVLDSKRANSAKDFENWEKKGAELKLYQQRLDEAGDSQDKLNKKETDAARRTAQQELNAMLREHATLLAIREQQQLINANPFLSADDKQKLSFASMTAELLELKAAIADTEKELSKIGLDPAKQAQLQADLKKDEFEFDLLTQKVKGMSFGGQIGADLVTWVNSFGTAAHQVAGIITNVLGTAIDGIAQATTGLIMGTKTWAQAWNQAAASVIQSIVKVVLQFIAGQIAMFVIRQIFGKQEQTISGEAAAQSAAAWAPAATSASIASYGAASGFGVAAYIAALGVGEAAAAAGSAVGGFKKGGYTGAGHEDEIAGPAHKGEFYFSKSETESIGLRNLYALRASAPRFGEGGPVLPTDPGEIEPGILPGNLGDYSGPSYGGDPSGAGFVNSGLFPPGPFGSRNNISFGGRGPGASVSVTGPGKRFLVLWRWDHARHLRGSLAR